MIFPVFVFIERGNEHAGLEHLDYMTCRADDQCGVAPVREGTIFFPIIADALERADKAAYPVLTVDKYQICRPRVDYCFPRPGRKPMQTNLCACHRSRNIAVQLRRADQTPDKLAEASPPAQSFKLRGQGTAGKPFHDQEHVAQGFLASFCEQNAWGRYRNSTSAL